MNSFLDYVQLQEESLPLDTTNNVYFNTLNQILNSINRRNIPSFNPDADSIIDSAIHDAKEAVRSLFK